MKDFRPAKKEGFTLTELMVVAALMAILASATPAQTQPSSLVPATSGAGENSSWRPSAYYIRSLTFDPERPVSGRPIKVRVNLEKDVQQPPLSFQLKVNGAVALETTNPEFKYPFKRGDRLEVMARVEGNHNEAQPVVAELTVENAPPSVTKLDEILNDDGQYIAHLAFKDPDEDAVTAMLQKGPDGMQLNGKTGELRWSVPNGTKGDFPIEVLASDSLGAQVVFSYTLTVK